ncbi:MAG: sialate O-acetylesterase [Lachnospiraceae bacterium]|nr:sialate O-acetylesterase [Lachnospiraceae bacterium]
MHGISLISAPADWEILQQENGSAKVSLKGTYQVHPAAIDVGVAQAVPVVRVMRESDNMTVIPWIAAEKIDAGENFTGSFETSVTIPAGGLYRIETSLETRSTLPNLTWLYRGDCVLHLGVGDLFVIAGQSNSAGFGKDFCDDPPHLCVHLFRNRSKWDLACHPMNESTFGGSLPNEEMGIPGVSPYLSFAKTYYEITGRPVGLIQTSMGGSPMSRWKPRKGDLYGNMMDKIHQTGGKYAGILWYQGCSDTDPEPAAQYFQHFKEYVEAVRAELGYSIPVFTMQLNRQINGIHDECWGMVRDAQRRAALEIPDVYVLSTTNLSLSDGIHNSAPSNVALGKKLAKQCAHVLAGGEEYEAPALCEVQRVTDQEKAELKLTGEWLKLTFDHVKGCLQIVSSLGKDSGFTLEDSEGEVDILSIRANREDINNAYLELERAAGENVVLSFAWQADPIMLPMIDDVTFLPPLSFYKYPILRED